MSSVEQVLNCLQIPLKDLAKATNGFSNGNVIGNGEFGIVYKGVSDGQRLLVYKYESNGSLGKHLSSTDLTWIQRLRICLDAARGLQYLHDGTGSRQRILHRDIKSSNILLDEKWTAKISDIELYKLNPGMTSTFFFSNIASGTIEYVDPAYEETGLLTKESDVYSFGVLLFEVLCGRIARVKESTDEHQFSASLIKNHWERKH
ncbi:putative receptor-like serine/threonine-protein kinase At4g34500 [Bidens hawaiensis]|uniref:putative receptor-like serine/threonine-protein kinase At4g34500 n=1 Tax=Bidens hawaiensis TaxID=980011 RepID=UPI00404A9285